MSKLLTPKIHTSSSSTKIPTSLHPIHPTHTAKSGTYTAPTKTTKYIYSLFLNQNTQSSPQTQYSYLSRK